MSKRTALLFVVAAALLSLVAVASAQEEGMMIGLDHPYAAFLESRAYGASLGATAEFRKMEWVVIDAASNKLYLAMSEVARGMSDGEGDISVDENLCGIVYQANLTDTYDMLELRPLVVGGPFDETNEANPCSVDNISEPDGLAVDGRGRVWIGEDTGNHENNMIWVYDPADGSLKRFGYTPLGAEVTGLYVGKDGSLFLNVQHPDATNIYPFNASVIGVVTGFNANTDDFESIPVPEGDAKLMAGVAAGAYQVLARIGDPIPNSSRSHIMGGIYDISGDLMFVGNNADGNMWLPVNEAGTEGWLYSNHETTPGGISKLYIRKTAEGAWDVLDGEMVDFASVNGAWINCGAAPTPWGTGLSGEEYEPIASDLTSVDALTTYLDGQPANPYDYGYIVEVSPRTSTTSRVVKHYVMGRKSNENAWVAPDNRTVYFGDDGTNTMLFKFVAAEAGNLSAGTLYAGKVTQSGGTGMDHVFAIEWIELGTATNDEIQAAIRELDRAS
jgi:secreted PhoX family phosphatase